MEYVTLKNTDIRVSRFCMGGCPMGGYGWGNVQENELVDAIHAALDNGVNFFDTADTYGLGQSELTLSKGLGNRRKDVVIQTKFGVRAGGGKTVYDNSPEYIRTALEASLKRLGTDYVDIYTIHYRDGKTPLPQVVDALSALKKEGKIRYAGLSNVDPNELKELKKYKGLFATCQEEFSLACRKNEELLKCTEQTLDLTPMTWGSLGQGILSGKYTAQNCYFASDDRRSREIYVNFHGEKLKQNLRIVEVLKKISEDTGKSIPACAIRFILDYLPQSVVIAGVKRPAQLESNIESMGWKLTEQMITQLDLLSRGCE